MKKILMPLMAATMLVPSMTLASSVRPGSRGTHQSLNSGSSLSSIPFIGWVLAGATSMIGMNEGADLGGDLAESFSDACVEEVE